MARAKKLIELTKDNTKVVVTVWDEGKISSCVEAEAKKYCETCDGDDILCQEYIEHLKSRGFQAQEIELGELSVEDTLPEFIRQRNELSAKFAGLNLPGLEATANLPRSEPELQWDLSELEEE